jgi:hypothetical protein
MSPTKKKPQDTAKAKHSTQQIMQTAFFTNAGPNISLSIFQGEKISNWNLPVGSGRIGY